MTTATAPNHPKRAILQMTLASALHFAGYEFARSATIALFTSKQLGFSSAAAMPAATGLVSPCSILLLWWYAGVVEQRGPRVALRKSTVLFAALNLMGAVLVSVLDPESSPLHFRLSQGTALILFITQNALVQLLFTQHWAFLGSMQTDNKSWFAPIAGIGSLSSTLAASSVGVLASYLNLWGLLLAAALVIGSSGICAEQAYRIAERHNFSPQSASKMKPSGSKLQHARDLFRRVPVLGALCSEVLVCQCLSSIISFLFILQVKEALPDDQERASWTGQCYAWINGASGIMQFAILPWLVQYVDPRRLWPVMPAAMLVCCGVMSYRPSLASIAGAFFTMKTLEYSLRGVANEMVFASLDYESRFVGKEIVGMFANRFGKSGMAVVMAIVADRVTPMQVSFASSVFTVLWFIVSLQVVTLIFAKTAEGKEKAS
jgi:ATP/ADP translocase